MSDMERIQEILEGLLVRMGFSVESISIHKSELGKDLVFDIKSADARFLTRSSDTLPALTHLARGFAEKEGLNSDFSVDTNGFQARHIHKFQHMADEAAQKVLRTGVSAELPPMTAFERKIVHSALESVRGVKTESIGEGRERRIVVARA